MGSPAFFRDLPAKIENKVETAVNFVKDNAAKVGVGLGAGAAVVLGDVAQAQVTAIPAEPPIALEGYIAGFGDALEGPLEQVLLIGFGLGVVFLGWKLWKRMTGAK